MTPAENRSPAEEMKPAPADSVPDSDAGTPLPDPAQPPAAEGAPEKPKACAHAETPADDAPLEGMTSQADAPPAGSASPAVMPQEAAAQPAAPMPGFLSWLASCSALLIGGALLSLAAANWTGWGPALRIAVFGLAALAAFLPAAILRGLSPRAQDASAAAGGVLTALLLAVIGQTWQTGEGADALLLMLSALLLPWLIAVRRPLIFTLWLGSLEGGLMLKGLALFEHDLFAAFLPAMAAAGLTAIILSIILRLRSGHGSQAALRAAAALPALLFALLAGFLPPLASGFMQTGLGLLAGLPAIYLLAAAAGAAVLWLSKLPELRAFAALTVLGWVNALLLLAIPKPQGIPEASLLYALTAINGLAFLLMAAAPWLIGRRRQNAPSQPARSGWIGVLSAAASGSVGAGAICLLLFTVIILEDLDLKSSGSVLLCAGILLVLWLRWSGRGRNAGARPFTALHAAGWALAFLLAASGWLFLLSVLDCQEASLGLTAAALFLGLIFPHQAVLSLALLAPYLTDLQLSALSWADLLAAAAALLTALAALAPERFLRMLFPGFCLKHLPSVLAALWMAVLIESLVPHCPAALAQLPPEGKLMIGGAAVLAAVIGALLSIRERRARAAAAAAILAAALSALAFRDAPELALPVMLSCAAAAAIHLRALPISAAGAGSVIGFLGFAAAGMLLFWASPEHGTNVLLAAASRLGTAGAALAAAAGILYFSAHSLRGTLRELRPGIRVLPLIALAITAAAIGASVFEREDILETGTSYQLALSPADPRDILMGDFMALSYQADGEAFRAAGAALGDSDAERNVRVAGFCLTGGHVMGVRLRIEGVLSACPKDTDLELAADQGIPRLPRRWFFPSGEAHRYAGAQLAELRCRKSKCILAGLTSGSEASAAP